MKKILTLLAILGLTYSVAFAQDEEEAVTEEEVRAYAVVMDSLEILKGNIIKSMEQMVEDNEDMTKTRYNELNDAVAKEDQEKLTELEATEEEVAFIKEVIVLKEEMTGEIQEKFKQVVKNNMAIKSYLNVKKALKKDEELKTKYDGMIAALEEKRTESEDEEVADGEDDEDKTEGGQ